MLTGGSRDVKPQLLSFTAAESAADTTTTTTVTLPVPRTNVSQGRAMITEVLKVWFIWDALEEVDSEKEVSLSTKNFGTTTTQFSDPDIFAWAKLVTKITTSGYAVESTVNCLDLTDGAGNGVLIATNNIFCQVFSGTTSSAVSVRVKVLYRMYDADVFEYIGIVQAQQ